MAKSNLRPDFDIQKAADEIKSFLEEKKMDLIDYGYWNIQAYPHPDDPRYPEFSKFARQWNEFFVFADSHFDEEGLPDEINEFEEATKKLAAAVNQDRVFWDKIRSAVIPLYERAPNATEWSTRWQNVNIYYYPEELTVTTTQRWRDKNTGALVDKKEVLSKKTYPAGFVVEIL